MGHTAFLDLEEQDLSTLAKVAGAEPIPGYRLIELLGRGGCGEVWKCEAPGGLTKAIKFVYGSLDGIEDSRTIASDELQAVERVKSIRHPFLISLERVESVGGELVIVMELADKSLFQVLVEYRASGHPGVPRTELLGYLRDAAEALDLMNHEHGLQHLDIKPHNLFLVSKHVKVADFGLVASHGTCRFGSSSGVTPIYASPETFQGSISRHSDQYSLAIVYQELLTGTLPFTGKNARQLLLQHVGGKPNLDSLSPVDREIVGKALAKEPVQRFSSCLAFVAALHEAQSAESGAVSSSYPWGTANRQTTPAGTASSGSPSGHASRNTAPGMTPALAQTPHSGVYMARSTARRPQGELLPGHEFLGCLSCTPLVEVWQTRIGDGTPRLVKFLYGLAGLEPARATDGVSRLRSLQYPSLAQQEVVVGGPCQITLVTEFISASLMTRFQDCQAQGRKGIPRQELLGYLWTVARTLDYLYQQHAVQHLGLNPRNLLLDGNRLCIADFGLVHLLLLPAGHPIAKLNARYSAPELFRNELSSTSDQYSLALIFYDLLLGTNQRTSTGLTPLPRPPRPQTNLKLLDEANRAVVERALDPNPQERWPTCTAFLQALEGAAAGTESTGAPESASVRSGLKSRPAVPLDSRVTLSLPEKVIPEIISNSEGQGGNDAPAPWTLLENQRGELRDSFSAPLPRGSVLLKLDEFRVHCAGEPLAARESVYSFRVPRPRNFWQQCFGVRPGLDVTIELARPIGGTLTPTDLHVRIVSHGCNGKLGAKLLAETGPVLLEGIRGILQANLDKRSASDRFIWHQPILIRPILLDGSAGEAIEGKGKDISLTGIGFYVPHEIPSDHICIDLPATSNLPAATLLGGIVRVQRCGDAWYEVGAVFLDCPKE